MDYITCDMDYITLREYDYYQYDEILLFNKQLTRDDLKRIQQAINTVRDKMEDYTIEDIKEAIQKVCPYNRCISPSKSSILYY